jgi:1-acyl-sn-glycerol-3-phosphate acyltransferase
MEKFTQFRDRGRDVCFVQGRAHANPFLTGSGISPFVPISTPATPLTTVLHTVIFLFRLPFFVSYVAVYFLVLHHLPFLPVVARKLLLWGMMGIPGIWWVDLQLDGVKRGHLSSQPPDRFPHPGSVIAANFTSPIDALYLAAIFDPVFTVSYPRSRKVRRVGLLAAVCLALGYPPADDAAGTEDLAALVARHPDRVVAVFPECATTNGRGILPFSPSLLTLPADMPIFPVSMRYTPPDITTPVPAAWAAFFWKLLSRPTHCIRVRIADVVKNTAAPALTNGVTSGSQAAAVNGNHYRGGTENGDVDYNQDLVTPDEQRVLDRVAEALARLGRNKRVGLTVRDKAAFVEAWKQRR